MYVGVINTLESYRIGEMHVKRTWNKGFIVHYIIRAFPRQWKDLLFLF